MSKTKINSTLKVTLKRLEKVRKEVQESLELVEWFNEHWYKINLNKLDPELYVPYGFTLDDPSPFLASVTTKLGVAPKPWIPKWRGQVGNWEADRVLREAQDKGSIIHNAAEILSNGGIAIYNNPKSPKYSEKDLKKITKGKIFTIIQDQQIQLELMRLKEIFSVFGSNAKTISTEFMCYDLENKNAGTVDGLMYLEPGTYIFGKEVIVISKAGYYIYDIKTGKSADEAPKQISAYRHNTQINFDIIVEGAFVFNTNRQTNQGWSVEYFSSTELDKYFQQFLLVSAVFDLYPSEKPKVISLPSIISF